MVNVCGCDPGKTGGWAIFEPSGNFVTCGPFEFSKPENFYRALVKYRVTEVLFERAQAAKGDAGQFEYGRAFGQFEAIALLVCGLGAVHYCAPQWWKARLNVSTDKAQAYAMAVRLWPEFAFLAPPGPRGGLDLVHGQAEAALIGSILANPKLRSELLKNNLARVARAKKPKVRYDWRAD